jgi:hypothetical protein
VSRRLEEEAFKCMRPSAISSGSESLDGVPAAVEEAY